MNVRRRYEFLAKSLDEKISEKAKDATKKGGIALTKLILRSHRYSSIVLYAMSKLPQL